MTQKVFTTPGTADIKPEISKAVTRWQEPLYKDLHQHPELSLQEQRTAGIVASKLKDLGYAVQTGFGRTGLVGVLKNGKGKTVLARADMDALPVKENTGLPYSSSAVSTDADGKTVSVAHACGHDAHVACLLGAAEILSKTREEWNGNFIALFQPAEELGSGAKSMLDDDLVKKIPRPDVAFGQHVLAFPAGTIGTQAGPVLSASDSVRITVYGKGSHGSMPHNSVDPVVLAAMIVLRLQTIVSRETKPGDFAVLTVGSSVAGTKSNIIADHAVLLVNLRTYDMNVRQRMIDSIERMVKAECEASGSPKSPIFEYYDNYPLTHNDPVATEKITDAFKRHFGEAAVFELGPQTASEDFSNIPNAFGIPYSYWGVGCVDPAKYKKALKAGRVAQDIPVNHSESFAPIIEPTLSMGTEAMAIAALTYLK